MMHNWKFVFACGLGLAWCASLGAASATPPADLELVDLTDDLANRASVSGNDDLKNSNGANAFGVTGDVPSAVTAKTEAGNQRFGGKTKPLSAVYEFVEPTVVNAYRIYNQLPSSLGGYNVEGRSPKSFCLEGSQTGEDDSWTTLDSETETSKWGELEARYYAFENRVAYKFYRLRITAGFDGGDGYLIIQEIELFHVGAEDALVVTGSPGEYGEPTPAYGTTSVASGASVELSAATPVVLEEDVRLAVCTGWTLSDYMETGDDPWIVNCTGTGASGTFVQSGGLHRWTWNFAISNRVTTATTPGGSVVAERDGWALENESVTLTAVPDAGYRFVRWTGDVEGLADDSRSEVALTLDAPKSVVAHFVESDLKSEIWVDPTGSDENDGFSADEPKKTVGAAVRFLDESFGSLGGVVRVAPGTYALSETLWLTNAVSIVGAGDSAEDVVLKPSKENASWGDILRLAVLSNASARVVGVTLADARANGQFTKGGAVAIFAGGGTVSNCVIRGAKLTGYGPCGGGAYLDSDDALVTHCRIEGTRFNGSNSKEALGLAAYVARGRLSNCLVTKNANGETDQEAPADATSWQACVVDVRGGLMDNCTVVENCHTGLVAGVNAKAPGRVVNCVVAGTFSSPGRETAANAWSGEASCFDHCVTDGAEPVNATCGTGAATTLFVDYAAGGYLPNPAGPLMNKGTSEGLVLPATDLAGRPRVRGRRVDVGCYESPKAGGGMILILR